MGFSFGVLHLSYKFKLLLVLALCVMVVGWASSNYIMVALQETPKAKSLLDNLVLEREEEEAEKEEEEEENQNKKMISTMKVPTVKSTVGQCPALSPYLRKCLSFPFLTTYIYTQSTGLVPFWASLSQALFM